MKRNCTTVCKETIVASQAVEAGIYCKHKHVFQQIYTVSKKRPPFCFSNNSVKNQPILMVFGALNPEKI